MNKLKLNVDALRVESFGTDGAEAVRGTVGGHNEPAFTASCDGSCVNTCVSCVNTCLNTCQNSCNGSCVSCWDTCDYCTHPGHGNC
jgi:hypothetical protein